jgi:hypothetical protein
MPRKQIRKTGGRGGPALSERQRSQGAFKDDKEDKFYFKNTQKYIDPNTHRWLYHYLRPDQYNAERMPDYVAFPSYVFRHRLERTSTIKPQNTSGDFIAVWAPVNSTQYKTCGLNPSVLTETVSANYDISANIFLSTTDGYQLSKLNTTGVKYQYNVATQDFWVNGIVNSTLSSAAPYNGMYLSGTLSEQNGYTGNLADHPFIDSTYSFTQLQAYAFVAYTPYDIASFPTPLLAWRGNVVTDPGLPLYTSDANTLFQSFSTVRLISGFFRGKVTSNVLNIQGIIKICMTVYTPRNKLKTINNFSRTTINSGSVYKVFTANQGFVIYYRLVNETHTEYGPYPDEVDNSPKLPVYIIDISGLSVGSQIIYESTRYHEGIPLQSMVDLLNPVSEGFGQVDVKSQFKAIGVHPADAVIPYQPDADLVPVIKTLERLIDRE